MNQREPQKIFVYVWEYMVKKEAQSEFERIYGPKGDWVQLFKKGEGYLGTELHRDISRALRYLTIDYWVSKASCETFREQFAQEFAALDRRCETLTEQEMHLGDFESLSPHRWLIRSE